MKKRLILLHWLNLALTGATLAIALGSLVPSELLPGISILALLLPLLMAPHAIALLFWLRFKPRKAINNVIGLAILAFPFQRFRREVDGKFTERMRMGKAFTRKFLLVPLLGRNLARELPRTPDIGRSGF